MLRLLRAGLVIFMLLDPRILTEIRRSGKRQTFPLSILGELSERDSYEGAERQMLEKATA